MKPTGWRTWLLVLMLSALTLLFASCESCPKVPTAPTDWPVFPDPPAELVLEGDIVRMPLEYWLAITRYAVTVRRLQDELAQ